MLRQASVSDLTHGRLSKKDGYIAIAMRQYPRGVRRELRDEYLPELAPEKPLFKHWLSVRKKVPDHDESFIRADYEGRFALSDEGLEDLKRLCEMSAKKDVYLICQCQVGERCHREFLLLMAKQWFKAKAERPLNDYPEFARRIAKHELKPGRRLARAR